MKKLFNVKPASKNIDIAILFARVSIAVLMLVHGISKFALLNESPVPFIDLMGIGAEASLWIAILVEVGCSVLILFGLGTRFAVIPLIVTMLVAVFIVHSNDPFAHQELGLHYLLVYVLLFLTGSGKYSMDQLTMAKI